MAVILLPRTTVGKRRRCVGPEEEQYRRPATGGAAACGAKRSVRTEYLDGIWGYERRLPVQRADAIIEAVRARK